MLQTTNSNYPNTFAANSDGYVEVLNMAGFVSSFSLSYFLNGQRINKSSGTFSLFFSRSLDLPANATNINLIIYADNGLGEWTPLYNNNWNTPQTVKAKLYGTIFSPQIDVYQDSAPPRYRFTVSNNAGFITRFILLYKFNNVSFSINSGKFSLGMVRSITLPEGATGVSILIIEVLDSALPEEYTIYTKDIAVLQDLKFIVSGASWSPQIQEIPGQASPLPDPKKLVMGITMSTDKSSVGLGEPVTYNINLNNKSGNTAKDLILAQQIPNEATLISNSLRVNGVLTQGSIFDPNGMKLSDIAVGSSAVISYQLVFNSIPQQGTITQMAVLNCYYFNSNNEMIGDSVSANTQLTVQEGSTNPCCNCCCCNCCCCNCCNSCQPMNYNNNFTNNCNNQNYTDYVDYMRNMGYF